ncbi:MAG: BtpA/SgcQ family protein [Planctomycetota bacterium]|nr:BtpA/SgcQ family protein [Planctomycetota bacterium]
MPTPLPVRGLSAPPSYPCLIAMIHVAALPGTPRSKQGVAALARQAAAEARVLAAAGFDAIMIENMHDAPYVHGRQGPEVVAAMTAAALAVKDAAPDLPLGVQVLSGGNHEALAIAHASGAAFIRCENFVYAHVADEGLLDRAEAGPLLRYRKLIGAERVAIWTDVKKKHASHAITSDLTLADCVETAAFFGADAVIVTGAATGKPTNPGDVAEATRAAGRHLGAHGAAMTDPGQSTLIPVAVGSGATPENLRELARAGASAIIVGSWIKVGGVWSNAPDAARCEAFVRSGTW